MRNLQEVKKEESFSSQFFLISEHKKQNNGRFRSFYGKKKLQKKVTNCIFCNATLKVDQPMEWMDWVVYDDRALSSGLYIPYLHFVDNHAILCQVLFHNH